MRVLWLLLAAGAHAFLAPARRRTCVRQTSIEEELMEELDATAETAEEDAEEEARYRADLEERTNKAKAATCWEGLPETVLNNLAARNIKTPLPAQDRAWGPLVNGLDAIVSSPTATGKTLAYLIPLAQRLLEKPRDLPTKRGPASPRLIVMAPSRELSSQIAKEWDELVKGTSAMKCALTIGGVPLHRCIASLRRNGGADVVVATPGRLAELIRQGRGRFVDQEIVLSFDNLETFVLDEADALLNEEDVPEVKRFLDGMDHDYQLALVSATITNKVRKFARGAMEIVDQGDVDINQSRRIVEHESIAAPEAEWPQVASELIQGCSSNAVVFCRSIATCKSTADVLRRSLPAQTSIILELHGDLDAAARRRVFREARSSEDRSIILVATDVAARGLDIDDVGLCLQLGAPLKAGRRGVLDADLYAHRFGRAARGGEAGAASIVAFDATAGEAPLVEALSENYPDLWPSKPPPAPSKVREAAIRRALGACDRVDDDTVAAVLGDLPALSDNEAKRLLAAALAALANVKSQGRRSRETGKASDRTLRVTASSGDLAPGAVVKALKALGSGKLGRVRVVDDGCGAYVEVPAKRAAKVLAAAAAAGALPEGWGLAEDLE
jgi:superfamily II DNA/RNA helicase